MTDISTTGSTARPSVGCVPKTRHLLSDWRATIGVALLVVIAVAAILGPILWPGDPLQVTGQPLIYPFDDWQHPFGTDGLGRDVLRGVLHGARISIVIGLAVALLSIGFGVFVGAIAGYYGGFVDALANRLIEIFQTIPAFVLLIVLVATLEPTIPIIILGLALVSWNTVARLTRAEVRAQRNLEYVLAAETAGLGHARILFLEILPNVASTVIATSSIIVAAAILAEAALSFMGLGDPNVVSWGSLIGDGREYIRTQWYLTTIPGLFIATTVLALNLLGDAVNDLLNPRVER